MKELSKEDADFILTIYLLGIGALKSSSLKKNRINDSEKAFSLLPNLLSTLYSSKSL